MKTISNKGNRMIKKKLAKYEFRYEVASERNKIAGYTLIPKSNRAAEVQHLNEHEAFQKILQYAYKGESEEVQKILLEFPEFKREDLKVMLKQSLPILGKTMGL